MCLNKLRIKNPSWNPDLPRSRRFIFVPCGKCAECRDTILNSMSFRAQQETLNCSLNRGLSYFNTFTYNDKYLPQLRLKDGQLISTWNKKHIQNFFKRLRNFLKKYYGLENNAFRYIVTCERGSDRVYQRKRFSRRLRRQVTQSFQATNRPHYHSIIWLYHTDVLPLLSLPSWCDGYTTLDYVFPIAFKHFWSVPSTSRDPEVITPSYGFIYDVLLCRTPSVAAKYVCKYIFKQYSDPLFNLPLSDFLSHNQDLCYKDMKPFSVFSKGVGSSFHPTFAHFTGEDKVVVSSTNKPFEIALPQYYITKYCKTHEVLSPIYTKVVPADWTPEGFSDSKFLVFNDSERVVVPLERPRKGKRSTKECWFHDGQFYDVQYHHKVTDTDLGVCVFEKRFHLSMDSVLDAVKSFAINPVQEFNSCFQFNPKIHKDCYSVDFTSPESLFMSLKDVNARVLFSQDIYPDPIEVLNSAFARLLWAKGVFSAVLSDKLSIMSQYYWHLDMRLPCLDSDYVLKSAISDYLHDSSDVSQPLSAALDIFMNFHDDMRMISSCVKKYNNAMKYKSSLNLSMEKAAPLFSPLDCDFHP